jgi:diguanylate cyclase (GGDEF)-like protein
MDALAIDAVMAWLSRCGTIGVARFDGAGRPLGAGGFLAAKDAPALRADSWRSPPLAEVLALMPGALWHGMLEAADAGAEARWPAALLRTPEGFLLVAEREPVDIEALGKMAFRLSNELAQAREDLAGARRELGDRDEQVRAMTFVDGITGLGNRRAFHQALSTEVVRSRRYGGRLALVLAAIDGLDGLAARSGEERVQDTLRCFARVVSNATRQSDVACRMGDNRCALMLPQTEAGRAEGVAERIRVAFEAAAPGIAGGTLTASFGYVAWADGDEPAALLQRADTALAAARGSGGNRVVMG